MEIVADPRGIWGRITVYKTFKIDPPILWLGGKVKQTHQTEKVFEDGVKWAIPFETWHHVKMVAENNRFKVYFNDELVTRFNHANLTSGKVRLSAIGVHAHFDDVVITGENIPDIGPSGLSVSAKGKLAMTWGSIKQEK